MMKGIKRIARWGGRTLFLLMLLTLIPTAYATAAGYDLYIGSTQVTDDNKGDILSGENAGKATFVPGDGGGTLTLKGVTVTDTNANGYSLYAGEDVVKKLVIEGDNTFTSGGKGICFFKTGEEGNALEITGTGTLTSTVTSGTAMAVNPGKDTDVGYVFVGENGAGPALNLTGPDTGLDLDYVEVFKMRGGTITAQATNTPSHGMRIPTGLQKFIVEAGIIAAYGERTSGYYGTGGAFTNSNGGLPYFTPPENGGIVYPFNYGDQYAGKIPGWGVIGTKLEVNTPAGEATKAFLRNRGLLKEYDLWIGGTQVTSQNQGNILGDNEAKLQFNSNFPNELWLTLNGVNIPADDSHNGYSLYIGEGLRKEFCTIVLFVDGENTFASNGKGIYINFPETMEGGPSDNDPNTTAVNGMVKMEKASPDRDGTITSTNTGGAALTVNAGLLNIIDSVTLDLTGSDKGADFSGCGELSFVHNPVIKARATNSYQGTGVCLPNRINVGASESLLTIAAFGNKNGAGEGGAFSYTSKPAELERVYPKPPEGETNSEINIDGWCVVTYPGGSSDKTEEILGEIGVAPVHGENGSYHTDKVPTPGVDIDVQGFTGVEIVYSVDVEWGAMTFQYEKSSWNPETHMSADGRGWLVYDHVNNQVLGKVQDAINRVTVTNHSNAAVYAKLSYADEAGAAGGTFEASTKNPTEDFRATFDGTTGLISLETADNDQGGDGTTGKATVGNVYFTPNDIKQPDGTVNDIAQWTKIGKITVALSSKEPTTAP